VLIDDPPSSSSVSRTAAVSSSPLIAISPRSEDGLLPVSHLSLTDRVPSASVNVSTRPAFSSSATMASVSASCVGSCVIGAQRSGRRVQPSGRHRAGRRTGSRVIPTRPQRERPARTEAFRLSAPRSAGQGPDGPGGNARRGSPLWVGVVSSSCAGGTPDRTRRRSRQRDPRCASASWKSRPALDFRGPLVTLEPCHVSSGYGGDDTGH